MDKETKAFSFKPDTVIKDRSGEHKINQDNYYVMLSSHSQGTIYYTPISNKFWVSEDTECPEDHFQAHFLPYLRWEFDELVPETSPTEELDVKGRKKLVTKPTGRMVNNFPPSIKNIADKRRELIMAASEQGQIVDQAAILQRTSPKELRNNEQFEKLLDKTSVDVKMAQRLNGQSPR